MQTNIKQNQRKRRWPTKADYVRLSASEAKLLIEQDVKINGLDGLLADSHLCQAQFFRGIDSMDHLDLIQAIRVGIERNASMAVDDPKWAEKIALREKQMALFGDLNQSIAVIVGVIPLVITPKTMMH